MLISAAACGNTNEKDLSNTTDPNKEENSVAESTTSEDVYASLETENLDGYNYKVLIRNTDHHLKDVYAEKENGDILNDAVFNRNLSVEEALSIKIEIIPIGNCDSADLTNAVRKSAKAGTNDYDIALGHTLVTGAFATEGFLCNWLDIENIDYEKPWWNKNIIDAVSIDGKLFFIMSDYQLDGIDYTFTMMFNKDLFDSRNMTYPYELVSSGKWTIDNFYSTIKDLAEDLDSNEKYDSNDKYGFVVEHSNVASVVSFMYASDQFVTKKNEQGLPELCYNTEKMVDITNKVYDIFWTGNQTYVQTPSNTHQAFRNSLAYMAAGFVRDLTVLRDMEDAYGIVIYPKYDEAQKNYQSHVGGHASIMCIPISAYNNIETIGKITDIMAAYTARDVKPKYYELVLQTKALRDSESEHMLDMLISGRVFDFAYFYNTGAGLATMLHTMIHAKNNNFVSEYTKLEKSASKRFNQVIEDILKIDN